MRLMLNRIAAENIGLQKGRDLNSQGRGVTLVFIQENEMEGTEMTVKLTEYSHGAG